MKQNSQNSSTVIQPHPPSYPPPNPYLYQYVDTSHLPPATAPGYEEPKPVLYKKRSSYLHNMAIGAFFVGTTSFLTLAIYSDYPFDQYDFWVIVAGLSLCGAIGGAFITPVLNKIDNVMGGKQLQESVVYTV